MPTKPPSDPLPGGNLHAALALLLYLLKWCSSRRLALCS